MQRWLMTSEHGSKFAEGCLRVLQTMSLCSRRAQGSEPLYRTPKMSRKIGRDDTSIDESPKIDYNTEGVVRHDLQVTEND